MRFSTPEAPKSAAGGGTSPQPPAAVVSINCGSHREDVRKRRDELIEQHLALVGPIAGGVLRSLPPSFELDDLVQAGRVGLLHAATRFRPELGVPFTAWARKLIRGAILDHVAGRRSELREVPISAEPEPSLAPVIDIAIDRERRLEHVHKAMAQLAPSQRRVVEIYYSDEAMDHARTGAAIGIDRRRAGELHAAAIERLQGILSRA